MSLLRYLWHFALRIGWDGLTAISTFLLAIIAGLSAWYAKTQIGDFRREARVKHLNDLVEQFERSPLAEKRIALGKQRTSSDRTLLTLDPAKPPHELHDILNFFEHVGLLLDGDYLDLGGVFIEFHYWIFRFWADAKKVVYYEQSESAVYYVYLQKMVKRLEEEAEKHLGSFEAPSENQIRDFYLEEADAPIGRPIPRQRPSKSRFKIKEASADLQDSASKL